MSITKCHSKDQDGPRSGKNIHFESIAKEQQPVRNGTESQVMSNLPRTRNIYITFGCSYKLICISELGLIEKHFA